MKKLTLILGLVLVLGACGASDKIAEKATEIAVEKATDGNVDISTDADGDTNIELTDDDGGTVSASVGDDLPDGFPFPVSADATVTGSITVDTGDGPGYIVTIKMAADQYDAMVAKYTNWLESEGFEVTNQTFDGSLGKTTILGGTKEPQIALVSFDATDGSDLNITFTWGRN